MTKQNFLYCLQGIWIICISLSYCDLSDVSNADYNKKVHAKVTEFRARISDQIYPSSSLVHEYISDELYSFRWLQSNNFEIERAVQSFEKHLAWRYAEKIDTIELDNWENFQEEYPQYYNTTDKAGRPIAELWLADWDVRRAVITGNGYKLVRWVTRLTEKAQKKLYEIRKTNKNVTAAMEIVDVDGFNNRQHACRTCYPFYLSIAQISEEQYPYLYDSVTLLNVGSVFRQILSSLNQQFGSKRIVKTRIYATRREWLPVLDKEIDKDQRSIRFGGTLSRIE